jgi:hypothetical protein
MIIGEEAARQESQGRAVSRGNPNSEALPWRVRRKGREQSQYTTGIKVKRHSNYFG